MKWFAWLGVCFLFAFLFAMSRIQVLRMGFEVTTLKQEVTILAEDVERNRLKIARKKNPAELKKTADELSLRPPKPGEVIYLDE